MVLSVLNFINIFVIVSGMMMVLIHDYTFYKYNLIRGGLQKSSLLVLNQKQADKIFRDINIEVNGFIF